jgi:hypothetical protein
MSVFDHSTDTVYIPSGGDVRHLSRAEKLALIEKAGLELQNKVVEDQALEAVMRLLSVGEIRAIIAHAGLSSRDAVRKQGLTALLKGGSRLSVFLSLRDVGIWWTAKTSQSTKKKRWIRLIKGGFLNFGVCP